MGGAGIALLSQLVKLGVPSSSRPLRRLQAVALVEQLMVRLVTLEPQAGLREVLAARGVPATALNQLVNGVDALHQLVNSTVIAVVLVVNVVNAAAVVVVVASGAVEEIREIRGAVKRGQGC